MAQEQATANRPFSRSFIGISRLLIGAAIVVVSLLLLLLLLVLVVGPTRQAAAAQAQSSDAQVNCGSWQVEQRSSSEEEGDQYWNYRWCHSPEVSGGYYKDYAGYSLASPEKMTVQETAAGDNNYPAQAAGNPLVYKSVDSRSGFKEGYYRHVLTCPDGYKAIGGGFDLNTPDDKFGGQPYWTILASRPADNKGGSWFVDAHGNPKLFSSLPTFTAYATCAPQNLLTGLNYVQDDTVISTNETKKLLPQCTSTSQLVIGGGFDFGANTRLKLVRSNRAQHGEPDSWASEAKNVPEGSSQNSTMRGWTVCLSYSALDLLSLNYQPATNTATPPSSRRAVANTPRCKQGTYVLSGGAGIPNSHFDRNSELPYWSNSSLPGVGVPGESENYWKASALTSSAASITVNAGAQCVKFAGS